MSSVYASGAATKSSTESRSGSPSSSAHADGFRVVRPSDTVPGNILASGLNTSTTPALPPFNPVPSLGSASSAARTTNSGFAFSGGKNASASFKYMAAASGTEESPSFKEYLDPIKNRTRKTNRLNPGLGLRPHDVLPLKWNSSRLLNGSYAAKGGFLRMPPMAAATGDPGMSSTNECLTLENSVKSMNKSRTTDRDSGRLEVSGSSGAFPLLGMAGLLAENSGPPYPTNCSGLATSTVHVLYEMFTFTITVNETMTLGPNTTTPLPVFHTPPPACQTITAICEGKSCPSSSALPCGKQPLSPATQPTLTSTLLVTKKSPAIVQQLSAVGNLFGPSTTSTPAVVAQPNSDGQQTAGPNSGSSNSDMLTQSDDSVPSNPNSDGQSDTSTPQQNPANDKSPSASLNSQGSDSQNVDTESSGGKSTGSDQSASDGEQSGGPASNSGATSDNKASPNHGAASSKGDASDNGSNEGSISSAGGVSSIGAVSKGGIDSSNGGSSKLEAGSGSSVNSQGAMYVPSIVMAGNIPISIASNAVVVGSHTVPVGSPPTSVIANGQTIAIQPSQIVAQGTTIPIQVYTSLPATSATIGDVPVVLRNQNVEIGSQTFEHGSSPTSVEVYGQTYSWDASHLVAAGTTVVFPSVDSSVPRVTAGGQVFSVFASHLKASGRSILLPNTAKASPFVLKGQTFSVNPSQIIAPNTSIALPPANKVTPFVYIDHSLSVDASHFMARSTTIALISGSGIVTYNAQVLTIKPSEIIGPSTTIALSAPDDSGVTPTAVTTEGLTFSIGPSAAVVGDSTYSFVPGKSPATISTHGEAVLVGSNGVQFGRVHVPVPTSTPSFSAITQGGLTFSVAPSEVVVDGHTEPIHPAMTPITTLVDSHIISIGPKGVGLASTTILLPTPKPSYSMATEGGLTFSVAHSEVVVKGETYQLASNKAPTTTTIDGQTITIGSRGIQLEGTTVNLPALQTPMSVTAGGLTFSVGATDAVISGTTYSIGSGAPLQTVIVGSQIIKVGSGGVMLPSTTIAPEQTPVAVAAEGLTSSMDSTEAMLNGTTYAIGRGAVAKTIVKGSVTMILGTDGVASPLTTFNPGLSAAHPGFSSVLGTSDTLSTETTNKILTPIVTGKEGDIKHAAGSSIGVPSSSTLLGLALVILILAVKVFMQPELNEDSQRNLLPQNSQVNNQDSQHGFHDSNERLSRQLHAGEGKAKPPRSASGTTLSASSAGSSDDGREGPLRRLSPPSTRKSGSPVDRIIEYENYSTYQPKKRVEGRAFTVVQRGSSLGSAQTKIGDFPNEILTHILSHLPPSSLSDVSLVSRRFHQLVTTPHAWRIAFSRFFPGAEALNTFDTSSNSSEDSEIRSERRVFTRLTALASWRSEYILRTRLLRSIARGKPAEPSASAGPGSSRSGTGSNGSAHVTYNSDLVALVDHLHATFGTGLNKRLPRFIHGATDVGMASCSDPKSSKVDAWGFSDSFVPQHFEEVYPGEALYGLGAGEVTGMPNTMDTSQPFGMIYAEGLPGGRIYYRSTEEKRGRSLASSLDNSMLELGIPKTLPTTSICSVWIAKTPNVPDLSEGTVGMLVGSSSGLVTAYSLGTNPLRERRLERGELTARWVLSPGVPIIAIVVDENFSSKRQLLNRIWAFALNALGEVFYLGELPVRPTLDRAEKIDKVRLEQLAWQTGRSVQWTLVEPTRRVARPDPFDRSEVDGSYSPRGSSDRTCLSKEQIAAETKEINVFLQKQPKHFQKACEGWDLRRRLEVDFAASDEQGVGESLFVIGCGLDEGQQAMIKRYTRYKVTEDLDKDSSGKGSTRPDADRDASNIAIFGSNNSLINERPTWSFADSAPSRRSSMSPVESGFGAHCVEEWRTTVFLLGGLKSPQISTTAMDASNLASLTTTEDPLLGATGSSAASSPLTSPMGRTSSHLLTDIPGQRARLLAIGTKTGTIILWNARAPVSNNNILENNVKPIRIIYTDSPQIACLAMTSLYLVHGGNDGLVQAWDPLASTMDPIRTLNSRFSSRARRRLIQAEASSAGVGINLFAAGAICLDPDPTILRGMVTLGSHLRYWSYSSQAADQYKGNKRRIRRSERGSNQGGDRFSGTGRGALKEYIANEKVELEREKRNKREEEKRLAGRFGVDLLGPGASEDEILAYATMLSEEAAQSDELRRNGAVDGKSIDKATEQAAASRVLSVAQNDVDNDMAEAIRLSLLENGDASAHPVGHAGASEIPVKYAKVKKHRTSPASPPPRSSAVVPSLNADHFSHNQAADLEDLDLALQLSQSEEESRTEGEKGKGRAF